MRVLVRACVCQYKCEYMVPKTCSSMSQCYWTYIIQYLCAYMFQSQYKYTQHCTSCMYVPASVSIVLEVIGTPTDLNIWTIFCVTDSNDRTFVCKNFPAAKVAWASNFPCTFCCLLVSNSSTLCLWWNVAVCNILTDSFSSSKCLVKCDIASTKIKLNIDAIVFSATEGRGSSESL